ncbi:MAG: hypothetical protein CMC96_09050 [Flavobacteriales bacterium]|nr:hypothetical protein [Flavobacteriales bacterium]|tara:strand:+ start:38375 stop:39121 length:747 start_codon:yes stop_codon:yes gene_type:complete
MYKKIYPLIIVCFFLSIKNYAQETIFEEKTTTFSSEKSGGIGMHTNGFHAAYRWGKYTSGYTKQIYEVEIANIRHPREIKSVSPFDDDMRGYVYGKKNALYTIRPSIGYHNVFVPKQSISGVSITYVTHIGMSLGLAKPIYLNVEKVDERNNTIIVRERYDPDEHQQGEIYGKASFINGIDEIRLYPGAFFKAGLHFDYGNDRETLRAIELGLKTDLFLEKIPIMAFAGNRQLYLNVYLTILFGAREE